VVIEISQDFVMILRPTPLVEGNTVHHNGFMANRAGAAPSGDNH
jgi:hypothetical protein